MSRSSSLSIISFSHSRIARQPIDSYRLSAFFNQLLRVWTAYCYVACFLDYRVNLCTKYPHYHCPQRCHLLGFNSDDLSKINTIS